MFKEIFAFFQVIMPNGINDLSPDLRDFLLNKNLILADSITDGGLTSLGVGLGKVAQLETLPNAVQSSTNIMDNGQFYRDLNLLLNPYQSMDGNELIDINTNTVANIGNLPSGSQPLEYQENIGSEIPTSPFNVGADKARIQMLKNKYFDDEYLIKVNLNTTLIASNSDGVYKFKESILSRTLDTVLNATNLGGVSQQLGVVGADTTLGLIGDKQLVKHFGYNAGNGLLKETLGHINSNSKGLLKEKGVSVPNFSITVSKDSNGGSKGFLSKVLGFQSLDVPESIIFSEKNSIVTNTDRIKSMILNTGKGQVLTLIENIKVNSYLPTINDANEELIKGTLYAFEDNLGDMVDLLSGDREGYEKDNGKITSELDGDFNSDFGDGPNENTRGYTIDGGLITQHSWGDTNNNEDGLTAFGSGDKFKVSKSLLYKTQELFKTNKMKTLVTGKGVKNQVKSDTQSAVHLGFTSKGSGVLTPSAILPERFGPLETPNAEDIFCRTWTTVDKYDTVFDLQKNRGLDSIAGSTIRNNVTNSVLDDNGFVRIAPNVSDSETEPAINGTTMKRFMFSIENLAWDGQQYFLPDCEKGPGDPVTGTKGRIMWFPPYAMNFTDSTSIDWTSTNFIGRGEPIYTYNNTERSGTLQWQMIIDHATYINDLKNADASDELFASIASGCLDLNSAIGDKLSQAEKDLIESQVILKTQEVKTTLETPPITGLKMYFPNDVTSIPSDYENGDGVGMGKIMADAGYITEAKTGGIHDYPDETDFALNGGTYNGKSGQVLDIDGSKKYNGWKDTGYIQTLIEYLVEKCPSCEIQIGGYSSKDGQEETDANKRLSEDRAKNVEEYFRSRLISANHPNMVGIFQPLISEAAVGGDIGTIDSIGKKSARYSTVKFVPKATRDIKNKTGEKPLVKDTTSQDLALSIKKRYFNECTYFEKLRQDESFVYASIKEKVKYFHAGFHSITPEGFNSRLTFLQQCTRQGPTRDNVGPSNLAFGTAPVCILRVGDFYHTKIIIDNINFSFDPLVLGFKSRRCWCTTNVMYS